MISVDGTSAKVSANGKKVKIILQKKEERTYKIRICRKEGIACIKDACRESMAIMVLRRGIFIANPLPDYIAHPYRERNYISGEWLCRQEVPVFNGDIIVVQRRGMKEIVGKVVRIDKKGDIETAVIDLTYLPNAEVKEEIDKAISWAKERLKCNACRKS